MHSTSTHSESHRFFKWNLLTNIVLWFAGNVNGHSIPFLQDEAQKGTIDAILHVGDLAYDMNSDNARVGDEFMRQIEPIAAYLPNQTCPGNHENAYNFSNYDYRFSMMQSNGQINNHYYR